MTETEQVPLIRNEHGAVLGADWRRTELSPIKVPGRIAARAVMPGDTIEVGGERYVVLSKPNSDEAVILMTRSLADAPVVFERRGEDVVYVVAVGAFDL